MGELLWLGALGRWSHLKHRATWREDERQRIRMGSCRKLGHPQPSAGARMI